MHQVVIGTGILGLDLRKVLHVLPVCLDERVCFKLLRLIPVILEVINSGIYLFEKSMGRLVTITTIG